MDPIYTAYLALRRYDHATTQNITSNLLKANPSDQYALLLKTQSTIEQCYFDETEFEEGALEFTEIDQQQNVNLNPFNARLPTSFAPGNRLQSGYVRPLTAAVGRPSSRTNTRLGTSRIATARLQTGRQTAHLSRMGTATLQKLNQQATLQSGDLFTTLSQLPENYGSKPIFRRLLPNYFLRLQALNDQDFVPNPNLSLTFLNNYQESCGCDWFFNDRAARSFYLLKNFEEAERHLRAAQRAFGREETLLKLSCAVACRGSLKNAIQVLEEGLVQFQNSAVVYLQQARVHEHMQCSGQALQCYSRALVLNPACLEALTSAASLIAQGYVGDRAFSGSDALQLYKRALLQRSQDPSVWNNIAACYLSDDLYGQAFIYLMTSLDVCNRSKDYVSDRLKGVRSAIYYNLGCVFLRIQDLKAAQDAFELSMDISPNSEACVNLGVLALQTNQEQRAIQLFTKAIEQDGNLQARRNRGIILKQKGFLEQALKDLRGLGGKAEQSLLKQLL